MYFKKITTQSPVCVTYVDTAGLGAGGISVLIYYSPVIHLGLTYFLHSWYLEKYSQE